MTLARSEDFHKFACATPGDGEDSFHYRELIRSLLYRSVYSRYDIASAVSEMARYVSAPRESHLKALRALKGLVRYIKGKNYGILVQVKDHQVTLNTMLMRHGLMISQRGNPLQEY